MPWYLERSKLKSSSKISSELSYVITSILCLFEHIVNSSSVPLEEIKLILIVNWIFQISAFCKIITIPSQYSLILFRLIDLVDIFYLIDMFLSPSSLLSYLI